MRIVLLISVHEVSVKLCIHMRQITGKVILSLNIKQLLASGGGAARGWEKNRPIQTGMWPHGEGTYESWLSGSMRGELSVL